jgi:hypothetical protein
VARSDIRHDFAADTSRSVVLHDGMVRRVTDLAFTDKRSRVVYIMHFYSKRANNQQRTARCGRKKRCVGHNQDDASCSDGNKEDTVRRKQKTCKWASRRSTYSACWALRRSSRRAAFLSRTILFLLRRASNCSSRALVRLFSALALWMLSMRTRLFLKTLPLQRR